MNLSPCPNCSGFIHAPESRWIIGRPQIVRGRKGGGHYLNACCVWAGALSERFDTEQEAADAWHAYRADPDHQSARHAAFLPALDAYEAERERKLKRLAPVTCQTALL